MTSVKRLRRESSTDEDPAIAAQLDVLRSTMDSVGMLTIPFIIRPYQGIRCHFLNAKIDFPTDPNK